VCTGKRVHYEQTVRACRRFARTDAPPARPPSAGAPTAEEEEEEAAEEEEGEEEPPALPFASSSAPVSALPQPADVVPVHYAAALTAAVAAPSPWPPPPPPPPAPLSCRRRHRWRRARARARVWAPGRASGARRVAPPLRVW